MHRQLGCKRYLNNGAWLPFSMWILIGIFVLEIEIGGRWHTAIRTREIERMDNAGEIGRSL